MNEEMRSKVAIEAIGKRKDCRCLERPLAIQAQIVSVSLESQHGKRTVEIVNESGFLKAL